MLLVLVIDGILANLGVHDAQLLWHWFGQHILLTILMVVFLA